MKKIFFAIIFILVFLSFSLMLFTSCRSTKPVLTTSQNESIYVEKIINDTIKLPADSSWLNAYFKCDSLGNVYIKSITDLKTKNIQSELDFKNGILNYKTIRPEAIIIEKPVYKTTKTVQLQTYTVEVNILKWWQKVLIWVGVGSLATLFLILLLKYPGIIK